MSRLKQIKIGVDALVEAKLSVRAEGIGASVSEYVRGLIIRDLALPPAADIDDPAMPLAPSATFAPQLLELALVTAILVRAQLARMVGEDEARKLEARAREKAAEQVCVLVTTEPSGESAS